jgi:hypothetical protein
LDKRYGPVAREAYAAAGAKDKLIALGDRCLEEERFDEAWGSYMAAGATDKLVTVGDHYFEKSDLETAQKAYETAGAKGKLISLGDHYLKEDKLNEAKVVYGAVAGAIPASKCVSPLAGRLIAEKQRFGESESESR